MLIKKNKIYMYISRDSVKNGAKLIKNGFLVQMDNSPKHAVNATQEFLKVKKEHYSAKAKSIS